MKILNKEQLKNIIVSRAKYQKVMLLYDEYTSEIDINKIYQTIKEDCIFNKLNIINCKDEIYNGYKVVIYMCSENSYLNLDIEKQEFINVFVPYTKQILPYFLNENFCINKAESYLLLDKIATDNSIYTSLFFNRYYNYLEALSNCTAGNEEFDYKTDLTFNQIVEMLNNSQLKFYDVELIAKANIDYELLPLVDYLLISAFALITESIKNDSISLVDVYKASKNDENLIDKFYAMLSNNVLNELIKLNFSCLNTICKHTKDNILNIIQEIYETEKVFDVIEKIKNYTKTSNNLLSYLYLYDVFSV